MGDRTGIDRLKRGISRYQIHPPCHNNAIAITPPDISEDPLT